MLIAEKKRLLWLDYTKVIGIYLVILGHIPLANHDFKIWIYSFHMPLFFLLSGLTEKDTESVKDWAKKGFKILIIPYAWFYLITYFWWFFVNFLRHPYMYPRTITEALLKPLAGMFLAEGYNTPYSTMTNIFLWFLIALFFCKLLFKVGLLLNKNKQIAALLVSFIAIVFVYFFKPLHINIPFSIDTAILAIPFYAFGYLIKPYIDKSEPKLILRLLLVVSTIAACYLLGRVNGWVDMNEFFYGQHLFLFYAAGVLGTFGIIFFSRLFANVSNRFFLYMGTNTLIIFSFHGHITILIKVGYAYLLGTTFSFYKEFSTLEGLIMGTIAFFLSVIPIYIINNYFPFVVGKTRKNNSK